MVMIFRLFLLLLAFGAFAARAATVVSDMETLVTTAQRQAQGLNYWPDGGIGVVKSANSFIFMAANDGNSARTGGTLANPIATQVASAIMIQNLKTNYDYIAGGYIYQSTNNTTWLMMYHTERWLNGMPYNFWSSIGMAKSTDQGQSWTDLGEIIQLGQAFGSTGTYDTGGGSFAINNGYLYVYFADYSASGTYIPLAVARAPIAEIEAAANTNGVAMFYKYYSGNWTQPGLGGASSSIAGSVSPTPTGWWGSVAYNSYLNKYILIYVSNWNLYMTTSTDGLNWSGSTVIVNTSAEEFYPTILGLDGNARTTAEQFYVYYTCSVTGGWNRWSDAVLARRMVSLSGAWPTPPSITAQPTNITVNSGQTATFTVTATGTAPLTYQWQSAGDIPNATNASYVTLPALTNWSGGTFCVLVANPVGVATSSWATLTVADADSVGDGITDGWRQRYFGGTGTTTNAQSCVTCDPDGDRVTNYQEFLAGTDPTNSASVFRITEIWPDDADVFLTWTAVGGKRYVLQTTTDENGSFLNDFVDLDMAVQAPGTGETTMSVWHLGAATNAPARFYRVRLVP